MIVPSQQSVDESLRTRARWWCTLWLGNGFGILGYPRLAILANAVLLTWLISIVYFGLWPTPVSFWIVVAMGLGTVPLWLGEYLAARKLAVRLEDNFVRRHHRWLTLFGYAGLSFVMLLFFINSGLTNVGGTGMAPTLVRGDWILYRKQSFTTLAPGRLVMFHTSADSAWGEGSLIVGRVLAVPGNRLSRQGDQYLLDGKTVHRVATVDPLQPSLRVPETPEDMIIPAGCFFIVQDGNGYDSQVLGWLRIDQTLGQPMLRFGNRGWAKELE